ncbi:MAG TPA: family 20 glycosylhydrolase [Tenuifilaceae bacterium]|nr:family 20 glycosylhydrolase [Tenuifilaceae bacterium]
MRKVVLMLLSGIVLLACKKQEVNIIPVPMQVVQEKGNFNINKSTRILIDTDDSVAFKVATYFQNLLKSKGLILELDKVVNFPDLKNAIYFTKKGFVDSLGVEGYMLTVNTGNITIRANSGSGYFYAVQTLRQLMPMGFESANANYSRLSVPCVRIIDKPTFGWRGLNLDCCRHFMSKDFVKRYIDLLAYHKMNILHWHLTEDQGWRIEIKKYPKLTEVGAWRQLADGTEYGGYYTQDDIREIVAYAAERYVNIVPEIEMPGHSVAALASYPQLSCTGEPLKVETNWGVFKDIYCAGNEFTFTFLQDVLTEVADLFPFPYIHIGGDEAPKYRWENCPKCRARLKSQKLKNYEELQQYFISRIAKFLETKGRRIIGWDEILEGGRPHNATVQAWRGMDRVDSAVFAGAPVIVSPTSHCYFDYPVDVIDLRKVYSFNPIPDGISAQQKKLILGGECNMWTEHAPQKTVDSKLFPRMLALSEVLWSYPKVRSYDKFLERVRRHYGRLSNMGVNYGFEQSAVKVNSQLSADAKSITVSIERGQENLEIFYTIDGAEPTTKSIKYKKPFVLKESATVKAVAFLNNSRVGEVFTREFVLSKSTGKNVKLGFAPATKYMGGGLQALVDGRKGTEAYNDGIWQAVQGSDMVATVDLGKSQPISTVSVGFLQSNPSWIFIPKQVDFFTSVGGTDFTLVGTVLSPVKAEDEGLIRHDFTLNVKGINCRYVRMVACSIGNCPDWHPAAGSPSWLFADEISVY